MHYYRRDLAFIHDRGYGGHADRCAPGILDLDFGRAGRANRRSPGR